MKGTKILVSLLSAATVLGSMCFTASAADDTMTFDEFVAKINAGETVGTDDGRITVTWSPVSGCAISNGSHTALPARKNLMRQPLPPLPKSTQIWHSSSLRQTQKT